MRYPEAGKPSGLPLHQVGLCAAEIDAMRRTVANVFARWGVSGSEAAAILSSQPRAKDDAHKQEVDVLSDVLSIHRALRTIFVEPEVGYRWMNQLNIAFEGQRPIDLLICDGVDGLALVRGYLTSVVIG